MWFSYYTMIFLLILFFFIVGGIYNKMMGNKGTYSYDKFMNENYSSLQQQTFFPSSGKKTSKGEEECRRSLQMIFNKPFPSVRPKFLQNKVTGGAFNLELDCYDEDMRLAVEYNGIQHYKYNKFFHKNYQDFLNQKYRDDMKRRICIENKIILIEVPYTVRHEDIYEYIRQACISYGVL